MIRVLDKYSAIVMLCELCWRYLIVKHNDYFHLPSDSWFSIGFGLSTQVKEIKKIICGSWKSLHGLSLHEYFMI